MTRHATLLFTSSMGLGSLKARYLYCNTRKRIFNRTRDVYGGRIESMADSVFIAARLVYNRATESSRINVSEKCSNLWPPPSGLYPMKAGLQLSDAIRFSYRYLESGQQDLTVLLSQPFLNRDKSFLQRFALDYPTSTASLRLFMQPTSDTYS